MNKIMEKTEEIVEQIAERFGWELENAPIVAKIGLGVVVWIVLAIIVLLSMALRAE